MANILKDLAAFLGLVSYDALAEAMADLKAYIDAHDTLKGSDSSAAIAALDARINALIGAQAGDVDTIINTFNEIKAFVADYDEDDTLKSLIDAVKAAAQSAASAAEGNAKTYADGKVSAETTRAEGAESALSARVTVLESIEIMSEAEVLALCKRIFGESDDVIRYHASAKLAEVTSSDSNGLHTNAFNANIVSHTFEDGVGIIEFDDDVTSVGNYAFYGCSDMTSCEIPSTVTTIGDYAFGYCSNVVDVDIPSGVTTIGNSAFHSCFRLESIVIPSSVTSFGSAAFRYCSMLSDITIESGVTSIPSFVFYGVGSLRNITIPSTVTSIGSQAFYETSLTSITIPSSVASIGNNAFGKCTSLTSITVDAQNTVYDSRDNCNAIIETATNTLLFGCKNTVIPSTVTILNNYAFYNQTEITGITIPNGVTTIGNYAFENCRGLTSITLPSSITTINDRAFKSCNSMASVTCNATTPPTLGANAFTSQASGRKIYVPSASVATYKAANRWSDYANDIEAIS